MYNRIRTESDLLALVRRQDEGEQREHGDESARDDEVEAVVESSTADVDVERDVDVRLRTAVVLTNVPLCRRVCMRAPTRANRRKVENRRDRTAVASIHGRPQARARGGDLQVLPSPGKVEKCYHVKNSIFEVSLNVRDAAFQ